MKNFISNIFKKFLYIIEAIIVKFGIIFFSIMPIKLASNTSSAIARFVGKKISVHKLAYQNLSAAMPHLTEKQKHEILDDMWDNLGRIVGEFPHVHKCCNDKIKEICELSSESLNVVDTIKNSNKGAIIFSAHFSNWEVGPIILRSLGIETKTIYRPLNNPYVEKIINSLRKTKMIRKSYSGNFDMIKTINNKGNIIILCDQRISEGRPIKFFHEDALTSDMIAKIALKYDVLLIPASITRLGKNPKFIVNLEKPLAIENNSDINLALNNLTRKINQKIEEWIVKNPSQWFWVHNRWKK